MAEVSVTITGPSAEDVNDAIAEVVNDAAEIALAELQAIWPVRTGTSRAGLHVSDGAVVGSASYTDEVRSRGSDTPIVDAEAQAIGERAAEQAVETADVSSALDGVITETLRHMER